MKRLIGVVLIILGLMVGGSQALSPQLNLSKQITNKLQKSPQVVTNAEPTSIEIPVLGIRTNIESVGKDPDGNMDVPKDDNNVGWYNLGPKPGEPGNSVIAGHYDSKIGPAIFYNLSDLQLGDEVTITSSDNKKHSFIVKDKKVFSDAAFPLEQVFGKESKTRLNLITCAGTFDATKKRYNNRVVIFTELKD